MALPGPEPIARTSARHRRNTSTESQIVGRFVGAAPRQNTLQNKEHSPNVTETSPNLAETSPNLVELKRARICACRTLGELGRKQPHFGRNRPNSFGQQPKFARNQNTFVRNGQVWPTVAQVGSKSAHIWPKRPNFVEHSPKLAEIGPRSAKFGRTYPKFGRAQPELVDLALNCVPPGPHSEVSSFVSLLVLQDSVTLCKMRTTPRPCNSTHTRSPQSPPLPNPRHWYPQTNTRPVPVERPRPRLGLVSCPLVAPKFTLCCASEAIHCHNFQLRPG